MWDLSQKSASLDESIRWRILTAELAWRHPTNAVEPYRVHRNQGTPSSDVDLQNLFAHGWANLDLHTGLLRPALSSRWVVGGWLPQRVDGYGPMVCGEEVFVAWMDRLAVGQWIGRRCCEGLSFHRVEVGCGADFLKSLGLLPQGHRYRRESRGVRPRNHLGGDGMEAPEL